MRTHRTYSLPDRDTIKPVISLQQPYKAPLHEEIWRCEGGGVRGIGTDPVDAYWDWYAAWEEVW